MNEAALEPSRDPGAIGIEVGVVVAAVALASVGVFARVSASPFRSQNLAALVMTVLLTGAFLSFSITPVREQLRTALTSDAARAFAGPALLWFIVLAYTAISGLPFAPRAAWYAGYLAVPALVVWRVRVTALAVLLASLLLWLPIEFRLLPALPLPPPNGFDASRLVGLVAAASFFFVARPVPGIGFTWRLTPRDGRLAVASFLAYAPAALLIGLMTGFLAWSPRFTVTRVILGPLFIYLGTAIPEEFLFRGLLQNVLTRSLGKGPGLVVAAVAFGLAHLPDPRYVLLATIAGVAYGWTYQRTGKITTSAITHALVDSAWVILLRR